MRISDWSSDVCSSDLDRRGAWPLRRRDPAALHAAQRDGRPRRGRRRRLPADPQPGRDRKSVVWGKSVSVRVALGGRRSITNKKLTITTHTNKDNIIKHNTEPT